MRISRRKDRLPGTIISLILLMVIAAFAVLLIYTRLLPTKYIAIIFLSLLIFLLVVRLLVLRFRKQVRFWSGTALAVLIIAVLGAGSLYIHRTVSALDTITGINTEIAEVNVYVRQEDLAETMPDVSGYTFGILRDLDRGNTDRALEQIYLEIGSEIAVTEYDSLTELADSLLNSASGAVILNRAYLDVLDQMEHYSSFSAQVREISSKKVETVVERKEPQVKTEPNTAENPAAVKPDEVYTIYISGIDTRGAMTSSSLSDVNIIATVNLKTKQILLVSTPRDYYVPLSISNGVPDKLTHAGIYGVNVCMDTLEMLYGIDINYYFRLNFAGFIQIIDSLGGVTINSDYDFDSQNVKGFHFNKGENFVNGEQALAFCRERYSFAEGDRQRGRNQMSVIQGVVNRVMSPELLKNYMAVLNELSGCFEMNIPYEVIASVVRRQLSEGGNWQVLVYSADGTGDTQKPYSMSQKAYVMVPDTTTVEKAKILMQKVREGSMLSEADVAAHAAESE